MLQTSLGLEIQLHELQKGKRYCPYVTTMAGLYRYNMNDLVEVGDFFEQTPTVHMIQKVNGIVTITGEKLHERQFIAAVREAEQRIIDREHDKERVEELINDRERDLEDKRGELDEIMQETREEEDILKAKAKDLELKIETRLLQSFKRIRKNARNGLGIVYVQRDACGGCFNKIPPQRQLDVKMHKKIIVCEHCGRILIDPELAGVKVEAATPEKPKRKSVRRKKAEE